MHVVSVFTQCEIGGAERVILNLMRFRQSERITHGAIVIAGAQGPLNEELSELGVAWKQVRRGRMRNPLSLVGALRGVRRAVKELGADVLLANASQGFLYAKWATVGMRLPVAVYFMLVPLPRLRDNHWFERQMVRGRPDAIFTASKVNARIVSGWGVRSVYPVHHGTPVPVVGEGQGDQVRQRLLEYGIGEEDPVLLFPGRLQPWKGQDLFIEAFAEVARRFPRAHGVILGSTMFGMDEDYPELLRKRIAELGLQNRVHLAGHQPVAAWLERATVVVHASVQPDPFPNVCIEAMAARRAVITNRISGTSEVLVDGESGRVVVEKDAETLGKAMVELLSDERRRETMAEEGYRAYLRNCTPEHMVRPIEEKLCELADGTEKKSSRPYFSPGVVEKTS